MIRLNRDARAAGAEYHLHWGRRGGQWALWVSLLSQAAITGIPAHAQPPRLDDLPLQTRGAPQTNGQPDVGAGDPLVVALALENHIRASRDWLRDPATGLQWTAQDNGVDIDWNEARAYCDRRGKGWRLPSTDELTALTDTNRPETPCGSYKCRLALDLGLTRSAVWSADRIGDSQAWFVYLIDGDRNTLDVGFRESVRALCVHRP